MIRWGASQFMNTGAHKTQPVVFKTKFWQGKAPT